VHRIGTTSIPLSQQIRSISKAFPIYLENYKLCEINYNNLPIQTQSPEKEWIGLTIEKIIEKKLTNGFYPIAIEKKDGTYSESNDNIITIDTKILTLRSKLFQRFLNSNFDLFKDAINENGFTGYLSLPHRLSLDVDSPDLLNIRNFLRPYSYLAKKIGFRQINFSFIFKERQNTSHIDRLKEAKKELLEIYNQCSKINPDIIFGIECLSGINECVATSSDIRELCSLSQNIVPVMNTQFVLDDITKEWETKEQLEELFNNIFTKSPKRTPTICISNFLKPASDEIHSLSGNPEKLKILMSWINNINFVCDIIVRSIIFDADALLIKGLLD